MSPIKQLELANLVQEQVTPTTDWARMVAMLADAKNNKTQRESGHIRTRLAITQKASRPFKAPQATKQRAAKQRAAT